MKASHILATTLAFLLTTSAFAGKEGGGGDGMSLEFKEIANSLPKTLDKWTEKPGILDISLIATIARSLDVETQDQLVLDGTPKDAINYPSLKKVLLSRPRWRDLNLYDKYALVLHEVLGILGIDDSKYQISSQFLSYSKNSDDAWVVLPSGWIDVCHRSDAIRTYFEKRFEMPCDQISPRDLSYVKSISISASQLEKNDLSGLSNIEKFVVNQFSNSSVQIPSQFFQFNSRLNVISIFGLISVGDEAFNTGAEIAEVNLVGKGLTCSAAALLGLRTQHLSVIGYASSQDDASCSLDKVQDLQWLDFSTEDTIPWTKIPSGITKLYIGSGNVMPTFPREYLSNLQNVVELGLNGFWVKSGQFVNLPNLKKLWIDHPVSLPGDGLKGLAATSLELTLDAGDFKQGVLDPSFLVPLIGLNDLELNLYEMELSQLDFSGQFDLKNLTLGFEHFPDRKTLAQFSNLKSLHIGYQMAGGGCCVGINDMFYDLPLLEELGSASLIFPWDLSKNVNLKRLKLPWGMPSDEKQRVIGLYSGRMDVTFDY